MIEHEEQQAALLDAYWQALTVDHAARPPAELDPQLATTAMRLESRLHAPEPDAGFRAVLTRRLDERARSVATATTSPNGRTAHVPAHRSAVPHPFRRTAHGWRRAAVLVLALIGIGVALLALPSVRSDRACQVLGARTRYSRLRGHRVGRSQTRLGHP